MICRLEFLLMEREVTKAKMRLGNSFILAYPKIACASVQGDGRSYKKSGRG